ncbi:MAG: diaminopimelate epimerase, partial [Candidatus Cloacimonetes bacterium]|nr:diaminopimelate epimerase [Candidatus Cloacimonadota bacterium]
MKLNFFKMQAQGNDYLFFDFLHENVPQIGFSKLAQKICDRHFGVGADGIILLLKSSENDASMKIYNADGSQAEMCGSALRCTVAYLNSLSEKKTFSIQTEAGQRIGWLVSNEESPIVKADFGLPKLINKNLLKIGNFEGLAVTIGNPHFVTFVNNLDADIAKKFGSVIEINE